MASSFAVRWVALCALWALCGCGEATTPPTGGSTNADSAGLSDSGGGDTTAASSDGAAAEAASRGPETGGGDGEPADSSTGIDAAGPADTAADAGSNDTPEIAQGIDALADATDGDAVQDANTDAEVEVAAGPDVGDEVDGTAAAETAAPADGGLDTANPCEPTAEACDGKDNDCDGQTDETDATPLCPADAKNYCAGQTCDKGICVALGTLNAPCDDGNACTTGELCFPATTCPPNAPACKIGPAACKGGSVVVCNDKEPCTADSCDPATGCKTAPTNCADFSPCTADACETGKGCVSLPIDATCDDQNVCTEGDACKSGNCGAGPTPKNCDDANACTTDSCAVGVGCKHTALNSGPCSDGSACTTEVCFAGACKATPLVCDDKNPCTADSCNASSGCTATAISGCTTCTSNANCDDKNLCTTDACSTGKCAWTPVAGCKGPTDYYFAKFAVAAPKFDVTTGKTELSWELANDFNTSPLVTANYSFWLSKTDGLDGDAVKVSAATLGAGNFTTPNKQSGAASFLNATYATAVKTNIAGYKYLCVELAIATDSNPSNNVACAAVEPRIPDLAVTDLLAIDDTPLAGKTYEFALPVVQVKAKFANADDLVIAIPSNLKLWQSLDDKVDPSDLWLGSVVAGPGNYFVLPKTSATFTYQFALDKPSLAIGPSYLCVSAAIDAVPTAWKATPLNDTLCAPVTITKSPNLQIKSIASPVGSGSNQVLAGLSLATKFQCSGNVANVGSGGAGSFATRCAIRPVGSSVNFYQADLAVASLGVGAQTTVTGDWTTCTPQLVKDAKPGKNALEVCLYADIANQATETNEGDNKLCHTVDLSGPNLTVMSGQIGGSATSVKRGVALDLALMGVKNSGNGGVSNNWPVKIVLSTDNQYSADDVTVCAAATGTPAIAANASVTLSTAGFPAGFKCTVPASTPTGPAHLLFVVDPDNTYMEFSDVDNVFSAAVTIVL